jgi:hypothetical protein
MDHKSLIALMLIVGCNATEVQPQNLPDPTEGGFGDTGGTETEGSNPDECWDHAAPAGAVRWQCEGLAEATILGTLHIDVPDGFENADFIQQVVDGGRLDWHHLFGPWSGEAYDDPGVSACCVEDIVGDDAEGADETGADPTEGDEPIPQAAHACAHDCADQACREIPRTLRDLAAEVPWGIPVVGPSYRDQLLDLANWVAAHQQECWETMVADGTYEQLGAYVVNGQWEIPNSDAWPVVTELSVKGECKVYDWYLPADGEPHACTGINDNNGEDPFGSGGSLGEFDTFAPMQAEMRLDGPEIFGVHAAGTAPILGLGDTCPRGECSRLDAWITADTLELRRLVLVAPSAMRWEQEGMQLTIDGLHAMVEHPLSIPLFADGDVMRFEIPEGTLALLVAGQVHGVPVKVEVPNATPVTGTAFRLFDGGHGIVIDPFTVEHHDAYGTWAMQVQLGELVALDHAPRATFEVQHEGITQRVDASASFDPDDDALGFEWYRDGTLVGEGPVVESAAPVDGSTLTLRVTDDTGRASWSSTPAAGGA